MSKVKKEAFNAGYAIAVANIVHLHEKPKLAADILNEGGLTLPEVETLGLTDDDLDVLRALYHDHEVLRGLREERMPAVAR